MLNKNRSKKYRKLSVIKLRRLQTEYLQGFSSITALAKRYDISRATVWKIAKENDWQYGSEKSAELERFNKISKIRLETQRIDSVEQHALEMQTCREMLNDINTIADAELLERKVDILSKCIKAERTAYGLPNDFRQLETKNETTIRVEDMLKTLDAKKVELSDNDASYTILPPPPVNEGAGAQTHPHTDTHDS
jgi:transposase-like protein